MSDDKIICVNVEIQRVIKGLKGTTTGEAVEWLWNIFQEQTERIWTIDEEIAELRKDKERLRDLAETLWPSAICHYVHQSQTHEVGKWHKVYREAYANGRREFGPPFCDRCWCDPCVCDDDAIAGEKGGA